MHKLCVMSESLKTNRFIGREGELEELKALYKFRGKRTTTIDARAPSSQ